MTEKALFGLVIVFVAVVAVSGDLPKFENTFENVVADEGSSLEILCSAHSIEPITYEWLNEDKSKIIGSPDSSISFHDSESGSSLIISKVSVSHEQTYICEATNEHGMTSKVYVLKVLPHSDNDTSSLRNVVASTITEGSVVFSIDVNGPVTDIEVKYNESRQSEEIHYKWRYGQIYEVDGLIPGGLYTFYFKTLPSETNMWSRPYEVTLLPGAPDVIFRYLDGGSIKLEWFRTIDDIMRGTVEKYELSYVTMQIEAGNRWIRGTCPRRVEIPTCAGSSYTLAGLSKNFYYEIDVRAHTISGFGESYRQKIFFPS